MKNLLFALLAFSLFLAAGCRSVEASNSNDNEVQDRGGQIVQAVMSGDYKEFAAAAGERADEAMAEEFKSSRDNLIENFGQFFSFRHFGQLETPMFVNLFYAVKFVRTGSQGKKIQHEQLMQLIFGKKDNRWQLVGMRFI